MTFLILIITYEGQLGFMNQPFSKFEEDLKAFKNLTEIVFMSPQQDIFLQLFRHLTILRFAKILSYKNCHLETKIWFFDELLSDPQYGQSGRPPQR